MTDEQVSTAGLELGRIVESFIVDLAEHDFIQPCECCGFPTPTPFYDFDKHELLCRNCRTQHKNGEHPHG